MCARDGRRMYAVEIWQAEGRPRLTLKVQHYQLLFSKDNYGMRVIPSCIEQIQASYKTLAFPLYEGALNETVNIFLCEYILRK